MKLGAKKRLLSSTLVVSVMVAATYEAVTAMYVIESTETVPISRVINNLETQFSADSTNAELAWRLGRLYGMAYAQKLDSIEVIVAPGSRRNGREQFMRPPEPLVVHSYVIEAKNQQAEKGAKANLAKAIRWYSRAHELKAASSIITLGYAWCLEQDGKTGQAKKLYREIIDNQFAKREHDRSQAVTAEALRYLIDLLNPVLDPIELRKRRAQLKEVNGWPSFITPIAIPLDRGVALNDIVRDDVEVCFDVDGSGRDVRWTWIHPGAAWLVHDFRGRENVKTGRDLFGEVTFWVFWENGYQAMASLDDDGDGWLRGNELIGLKLWNDRDSNGICTPGELRTLPECDIIALCCDYAATACNGRRMWMSSNGVQFSNGSFTSSYDVVLTNRESSP